MSKKMLLKINLQNSFSILHADHLTQTGKSFRKCMGTVVSCLMILILLVHLLGMSLTILRTTL